MTASRKYGGKARLISTGAWRQRESEAQAKLIEDESRFIDFSQSSVFMTEEHAVF